MLFRSQMAELADSSVHLVVTSPPYWQLKDYGADNQIGFNDSYENYINNLNLVWKECYRVLYNGWVLATIPLLLNRGETGVTV